MLRRIAMQDTGGGDGRAVDVDLRECADGDGEQEAGGVANPRRTRR